MSKFWDFIKYWVPTMVWMVVIFSASADGKSYQHSSRLFVPFIHWLFPGFSDNQVEALHHFCRKCCHFGEYGILALLIHRTLRLGLKTRYPAWSGRLAASVIGLVFLYASSDEFHQSFVPTRTPLFSDVMIDTAGGATGLLVAWLLTSLWRRVRKKSPEPV